MTIGGGGGGGGGGGSGRRVWGVSQPANSAPIARTAAKAQTRNRDSKFEMRKGLEEKLGAPPPAIAKRLIRG
jgi:hypothetical protein